MLLWHPQGPIEGDSQDKSCGKHVEYEFYGSSGFANVTSRFAGSPRCCPCTALVRLLSSLLRGSPAQHKVVGSILDCTRLGAVTSGACDTGSESMLLSYR